MFDGSLDLPTGPSTRLRLSRLTSAEIANLASPTVGDLVFDVTLGKVRVWDGTSWQIL